MPNLSSRLKTLAKQVQNAHETICLVIPSHSLVEDAVAYASGEPVYQRIEKAIVEVESKFAEKSPFNLPLLNAARELVVATDLVAKHGDKQRIGQPLAEIERKFEECERKIKESIAEIESRRTALA